MPDAPAEPVAIQQPAKTSDDGFSLPQLLPRGTLVGAGVSQRSGGTDQPRGLGLRAEYGLGLDSTWDLSFGVMLAGGYDETFGASFDGQLALGTGYKGENVQAQWLGGAGAGKVPGYDSSGQREGGVAFDVFHGPDLTIGAEADGLVAHARLLFVYGGGLSSGTRITGDAVYRWPAGNELGLALTRHHLGNDENILGLALIYRTARD
jgi:hypothetical protein